MIGLMAVAGFLISMGLFGALWRGGFFSPGIITSHSVEMPLLIVTASADDRTRCGDKKFTGSVDVILMYGNVGLPNAEVKVKLETRNHRNLSVALDETDVGVFRNDEWKTVRFDGELTDPCAPGKFLVAATATSTGAGATMIADGDPVLVKAIDELVDMPAYVQTLDGRKFEFEIKLDCCGAGPLKIIIFEGASGVNSLTATPPTYQCAAAGGTHVIKVKGKKDDVNSPGTFRVKARTGGADCYLGSVQVE